MQNGECRMQSRMENAECRTKETAATFSTFFIPHSTFFIPHSTFFIPHSTFFIPHSTFFIPHSTFFIPHSAFLYSTFLIILPARHSLRHARSGSTEARRPLRSSRAGNRCTLRERWRCRRSRN